MRALEAAVSEAGWGGRKEGREEARFRWMGAPSASVLGLARNPPSNPSNAAPFHHRERNRRRKIATESSLSLTPTHFSNMYLAKVARRRISAVGVHLPIYPFGSRILYPTPSDSFTLPALPVLYSPFFLMPSSSPPSRRASALAGV